MTGSASPASPSARSSGWFRPNTPRAAPGPRDRSPRPATVTPAGCWSRPPGTTARAYRPLQERCTDDVGAGPRRRPGTRRRRQPQPAPAVAEVHRAQEATPVSPPPRSPASWPAGAGPWPSSTTSNPTPRAASRHRRGDDSARSDPRTRYEQPHPRPGPRSTTRHADPLQPNTRSCGSQPAHISLTARRQRHADRVPRRPSTRRPPRPNRDGRLTTPLDRKPLHIRACLPIRGGCRRRPGGVRQGGGAGRYRGCIGRSRQRGRSSPGRRPAPPASWETRPRTASLVQPPPRAGGTSLCRVRRRARSCPRLGADSQLPSTIESMTNAGLESGNPQQLHHSGGDALKA